MAPILEKQRRPPEVEHERIGPAWGELTWRDAFFVTAALLVILFALYVGWIHPDGCFYAGYPTDMICP